MVPIAILSSELKVLSVIEVVTVTCNILRSHWGTQCNEIKLLPPKYICEIYTLASDKIYNLCQNRPIDTGPKTIAFLAQKMRQKTN